MSDPFTHARALAVAVGRLAINTLSLDDLDEAIAAGEHAQAVGPILDPTLARDAGGNLDEQLRYLRAVRDFRHALESFRPATNFPVPTTGDTATTTVEARGRPDSDPDAASTTGEPTIGRAAGAHLTGQRQDGPSHVPAHATQHPRAARGGSGRTSEAPDGQ